MNTTPTTLLDLSKLPMMQADGLIITDTTGRILTLSRTARVLLGLSPSQAPERLDQLPLVPTPAAYRLEPTVCLARTRYYSLKITTSPLTDNHGDLIGSVFMLEMSDEDIPRPDPQMVINTLSHELRTPLTVLSGASELLLRGTAGSLSEEQRALLEAMYRHTQTIASLLTNLMTITAIESDAIELKYDTFDCSELLRHLVEEYQPLINQRNLTLIDDIPTSLPFVRADPSHLRTVLIQILDNARRYTNTGSITLRASYDLARVRVDISDTGPGLGPETASRLFSGVVRGVDHLISPERGAGLGLAIAHRLIARQGGALWLEKTSAAGSTFSLVLPRV